MVNQEEILDYMNLYEDCLDLDTPSLIELHKSRRIFTNKQERLEFFVTQEVLEERKYNLIQKLEDELNQNPNQINLRSLKLHHLLARLYFRNEADYDLAETHKNDAFSIYEILITKDTYSPQTILHWGEILMAPDKKIINTCKIDPHQSAAYRLFDNSLKNSYWLSNDSQGNQVIVTHYNKPIITGFKINGN
nr:hypothetical protein [Nanoarchaeum sp.]